MIAGVLYFRRECGEDVKELFKRIKLNRNSMKIALVFKIPIARSLSKLSTNTSVISSSDPPSKRHRNYPPAEGSESYEDKGRVLEGIEELKEEKKKDKKAEGETKRSTKASRHKAAIQDENKLKLATRKGSLPRESSKPDKQQQPQAKSTPKFKGQVKVEHK